MIETGRRSQRIPDELRHTKRKDSEAQLLHPIWYATKASPLRPEQNQDQIIIDSRRGVIGVFDGAEVETMGENASVIAKRIFKQTLIDPRTPQEAFDNFDRSFTIAREAIASDNAANVVAGSGKTTMTIAQLIEQEGKKQVAYAHIGSSRLSVLKEDGRIQQLTTDDNGVQRDLEAGAITQEEAILYNMLLDTAIAWHELGPAQKYWNRSEDDVRGVEARDRDDTFQPQTGVYTLTPEDRLLLITSNGVHDNLTTADISSRAQGHTPAEFVRDLIEAAYFVSGRDEFRSSADDMTAVAIQL